MPDNFTPEIQNRIKNRAREYWQDAPLKQGLDAVQKAYGTATDTALAGVDWLKAALTPTPAAQDIELKPDAPKAKQRLLHEQLLRQMVVKKRG